MSNNTVVTVDGWPILNPVSWSAFLPPKLASQEEIEGYILAGVTGAFVWDLLNNIRKDCTFVARHTKFRLPTVIYFLSKLATFGFVLLSTIFQTAPISDCFRVEKAMAVLFSVAVPSTALLFFFRARAVFAMNPLVVGLFAVLWLGVLGGCLTTIPGLAGENIGPTPYCITGVIRLYSAAGAITPLINDSIMFCAISWRLWSNTWTRRTVKNGFRAMVFGEYLPAFSRSLLQDGQIYFLATVSCNILTVSMAYATAVPIPYRTVFTVPNAALMNIMACRIYRRMVLGDSSSSPYHTNSSTTAPISLSLVGDSGRTKNPTTENLTVNPRKTVQGGVVRQDAMVLSCIYNA